MVSQLKVRTDFYRMRSAEGYKVYNREGIFQIAGENRRLTSKLRFSDDGHPCLYLGASLYIAWEEVRRASFYTVNFARFRNTKALSVLDLTMRPRCRCLTDFVMCYLCLLTSAKVEDDDKYKYRYEVSGLLMKLLQNSIAHKGNVDGIKYISSRQFDGSDIEMKGRTIMEAYVFPPKESLDNGVDKWLNDTFEVSAVRTTFMYNIHQINIVNPKKALTCNYQDTMFYELEQQLKKEKMEKVK
ncbi:MAG: RES domain-containing protein [Bacteroidia bacterium]|nr:RES domain-containing protein [Bacteroidia bacterium]